MNFQNPRRLPWRRFTAHPQRPSLDSLCRVFHKETTSDDNKMKRPTSYFGRAADYAIRRRRRRCSLDDAGRARPSVASRPASRRRRLNSTAALTTPGDGPPNVAVLFRDAAAEFGRFVCLVSSVTLGCIHCKVARRRLCRSSY